MRRILESRLVLVIAMAVVCVSVVWNTFYPAMELTRYIHAWTDVYSPSAMPWYMTQELWRIWVTYALGMLTVIAMTVLVTLTEIERRGHVEDIPPARRPANVR